METVITKEKKKRKKITNVKRPTEISKEPKLKDGKVPKNLGTESQKVSNVSSKTLPSTSNQQIEKHDATLTSKTHIYVSDKDKITSKLLKKSKALSHHTPQTKIEVDTNIPTSNSEILAETEKEGKDKKLSCLPKNDKDKKLSAVSKIPKLISKPDSKLSHNVNLNVVEPNQQGPGLKISAEVPKLISKTKSCRTQLSMSLKAETEKSQFKEEEQETKADDLTVFITSKDKEKNISRATKNKKYKSEVVSKKGAEEEGQNEVKTQLVEELQFFHSTNQRRDNKESKKTEEEHSVKDAEIKIHVSDQSSDLVSMSTVTRKEKKIKKKTPHSLPKVKHEESSKQSGDKLKTEENTIIKRCQEPNPEESINKTTKLVDFKLKHIEMQVSNEKSVLKVNLKATESSQNPSKSSEKNPNEILIENKKKKQGRLKLKKEISGEFIAKIPNDSEGTKNNYNKVIERKKKNEELTISKNVVVEKTKPDQSLLKKKETTQEKVKQIKQDKICKPASEKELAEKQVIMKTGMPDATTKTEGLAEVKHNVITVITTDKKEKNPEPSSQLLTITVNETKKLTREKPKESNKGNLHRSYQPVEDKTPPIEANQNVLKLKMEIEKSKTHLPTFKKTARDSIREKTEIQEIHLGKTDSDMNENNNSNFSETSTKSAKARNGSAKDIKKQMQKEKSNTDTVDDDKGNKKVSKHTKDTKITKQDLEHFEQKKTNEEDNKSCKKNKKMT